MAGTGMAENQMAANQITEKWTMTALIDELSQQGVLGEEAGAAALEAVRTDRSASGAPWFVSVLMGGAAWLAASFLLSFLVAFQIFENALFDVIVGAVFVAGATWLAHRSQGGVFWGQLAFVFSLTGQGLMVGGVFLLTEELVPAVLAGILLETVVIFIYPSGLHRFLSVLAIVAGVMALLFHWDFLEGVHGVIALLTVGATVVTQREIHLDAGRWHTLRAPLLYGISLSLLSLCVLSLIDVYEATYWWVSLLALVLMLLYAAFSILAEVGIAPQGRVLLWLLGGLVLVSIPAYQTPGILAAILVLVLGFWRRERLLMGLASLFLAGFVMMYYYNLNITLLIKSFILVGTGVLLLLLRLVWRRTNGTQPQVLENDSAQAEGGAL